MFGSILIGLYPLWCDKKPFYWISHLINFLSLKKRFIQFPNLEWHLALNEVYLNVIWWFINLLASLGGKVISFWLYTDLDCNFSWHDKSPNLEKSIAKTFRAGRIHCINLICVHNNSLICNKPLNLGSILSESC